MAQSRSLGDLASTLSGTSNTDISFDSGTFYIDAINNRVGFGTSTPAQIVDIVGTANVSSTLNAGTVSVAGNTTSGNVSVTGTISGATIVSSTLNAGTVSVAGNTISGNVIATGTISGATISGSGANITNLSANNLIGTLPSQVLINSSLGTANNVQFNSLGIGTAASGTSGEIRATHNVTAYYSDDRLKTKLGEIQNALEKVCSLSGFYYQANEIAQELGYEPIKEVGISAQEVEKVLPEVVAPAPIDEKYLTVRYERIIPLLIEAIKELNEEINQIKGDNNV